MTSIVKTSSKMNIMQSIRQHLTSKFAGTKNVLFTCYGNIYEARGIHNIVAIENATNIRRFKNTLKIGIPLKTMHTIADDIKNKGYNLHVIYRGDGGAVHYHPFDSPNMIDRRSEWSQLKRDRIEFERKQRILSDIRRRKSIYQEHEFYVQKQIFKVQKQIFKILFKIKSI